MEEKKLDKNSVLGFVLIGAILIWMLYTQSAQKEKIQAETAKKEIPKSEAIEKKSTTPQLVDSEHKHRSTTDVDSLQNEQITLENDVIFLKIDTKGGKVSEVLLKNQKSYTGESVYLIKDGNADFNIEIKRTDNRIINTRQLFFSPLLTKSESGVTLSLVHDFDEGQSLEFRYTLPKDGYLIHFDVDSKNLKDVISNDAPGLSWELKGFRHAKSVKYENRYTMLSYLYEDDKVSELSASGDDDETEQKVRWVAFRQHFFNAILIGDTPFSKAMISSDNLVKDEGEDVMYTKNFKAEMPLELSNGVLKKRLHWYYGITDYKTLAQYDDKFELSRSMYLGWGIFGWLNKHVFIPLFDFLCKIVPHGIAIILLTILVRLVMSPATYKSYLSQAKMRVLHPEISEINKKHQGKENAMKRQQEVMALYRKAGVNPMSGCIPALLQLPVFYALFTFFPTAFVLRQKQFLWAEDLSSYDTVFRLPFSIPFYGSHVSLFPLLASVAIFFYMRMTSGQTMQQQQQPGMPNMKFLLYLSPVMMLFFFNNYASGLSLYYFISNLITIVIMLVIKNVIIDQEKIHNKIQENKKKAPKGKSRFQRKMQEMMEQAESKKKNIKSR